MARQSDSRAWCGVWGAGDSGALSGCFGGLEGEEGECDNNAVSKQMTHRRCLLDLLRLKVFLRCCLLTRCLGRCRVLALVR